MPRSPADNESIRAARRDEIFRAAARVFAKKGFAATKIADIAAEAGLSHGLLYHYYRSKEAVFAALVDEAVLRKPVRADVVRGATTAMERLERSIGLWLEHVTGQPELAIVIAQAFITDTLPPRARTEFLRFARAAFRDMVDDIREAQRDGDATSEVSAEELALTIASTMRGLAMVRCGYAAVCPRDVVPSLGTVLRVLRRNPDEAATARAKDAPSSVGLKVGSRNGAKQKEQRRAARG